ncbi:MAG: hypothetical protein ACRD1X_15820 [Vicinamibacteria bacterium]
MSRSDFLSWALVRVVGLVRHLPGAVLRARYPVPRIRERLTVLAAGVGPHIFVSGEAPARIHPVELIIINRLPFAVEIEGLHAEICLESRVLASCDKVNRLVIEGGDVGRLPIGHDLTDSQAELVRRYPEGQRPTDCAILRVGGELNIRTSFRTLTAGFGVETRAFIYRGHENESRIPGPAVRRAKS